jgi:HK97 family phage portal protein
VIIRQFLDGMRSQVVSNQMMMPELVQELNLSGMTISGQSVNADNFKNVSTAYRCMDILCNDFAKLPEQVFISRMPGEIERQRPSAREQNHAWLLEKSPNRWMTPLKFKRLRMHWLLTHGASYVWQPPRRPGRRRELFILPSDRTRPVFDQSGNLWYETIFSNGQTEHIPSVEVMAMIINSTDGISGRGVITFARETFGRLMGADLTKGKFFKQGLNPGGILWMNGDLNPEARQKAREKFAEGMSGAENAYSLVVMDAKANKFEQISMKPMDVAFLSGIEQDDLRVADFFNMPMYKLNRGKEAYNSNEQKGQDYLDTTLDPYLIQAEEVDAQGLLSEMEQEYMYIRVNRDALMRADVKTRVEAITKRIFSGQLTLNQANQIEDQPSFPGGNIRLIPSNMATLAEDGTITPISTTSQSSGGENG